MKGEACSFGTVGSGPVLDLNGEILTFVQTGVSAQVMGHRPPHTTLLRASLSCVLDVRYIPRTTMPGLLQSQFDAAFDSQDMCLRKPAGIESAQGSIASPGFDSSSLFPGPCHGENRGLRSGEVWRAVRVEERSCWCVEYTHSRSVQVEKQRRKTNNLVPPAICHPWV
jgi:hypothetical protein